MEKKFSSRYTVCVVSGLLKSKFAILAPFLPLLFLTYDLPHLLHY